MGEIRNTRQRGTPDFPVSVYWGFAGVNMRTHPNAEYHPEPEIVLVSQGSVAMQIGGEMKAFSSGDIFIIPPNVVHWRRRFSEDAKIWTIVFSPEAIQLHPEHFFQKEFVLPFSKGLLEFPPLLQPGHPAYDEVYDLMTQLDRCLVSQKNYRHQRLRILMSICLALSPHCRTLSHTTPAQDPGHEAVKLCMRYIHSNYDKRLTLGAIAEHCHLHPNYLCAVFKQYTGETVFEYRNRYRVELAEALLRREELTVSKVAELAGFRSECQFYQKFKEHTGTTPKAYAKKAKGTND